MPLFKEEYCLGLYGAPLTTLLGLAPYRSVALIWHRCNCILNQYWEGNETFHYETGLAALKSIKMKVKSMQRPGTEAIRTQSQTKQSTRWQTLLTRGQNMFINSKLNVRRVHGLYENYEGYIPDLNASFSTISS